MKSRNLQKIRFLTAILAAILYIAGFLGFFYPIKLFDANLAPLIQRFFITGTIFSGILLSLIIILTALFGRIYCSTLCPLGLYQELCLLLFHHKKLPQQKNRHLKYFITALSFGSLLGGTSIILQLIDPYTIFGSALSGTTFGLIFISFIAALTGIRGRWFCTNICPVGTILGIISKYSRNQIHIVADNCVACGLCATKCPAGCIDVKNKTVNNETCLKCFKCLGLCHNKGLIYGKIVEKKRKETPKFSASRRRFLIGAAALGTLTAAYKAGLKLSSEIATKVKNVILPPGAVSPKHFANTCLNCNLCVENCPMKIIKKKNDTVPTIHIDFGKNYCAYNCHKCSEICPSGAIHRLTLKEKRKTQIATSSVNTDICIQCGLCVLECPRKAIVKPQGEFPQINTDICSGCGACHAVCPVSAITIKPVNKQKTLDK